jgi:hypothetical protein
LESPAAPLVEELSMAHTASFSTFVRPPGSPIYAPTGPSLVLPRRTYPARGSKQAAVAREATPDLDLRRQLGQLLALIRAADLVEPAVHPADTQNEEVARSLQQLELRLAERERAVQERELRADDRERDMAEAEVLLRHREALLAASRRTPSNRAAISDEERAALLKLRAELERQEALIRESREALRDREKFIAESEDCLFAKVQSQQEKETELEQREEELRAKERAFAQRTGLGLPEKAEPFDEFNE